MLQYLELYLKQALITSLCRQFLFHFILLSATLSMNLKILVEGEEILFTDVYNVSLSMHFESCLLISNQITT